MKLVTFSSRDGAVRDHVGLLEGQEVLSITEAGLAAKTMLDVVRLGDRGLKEIAHYAASAPRWQLENVVLAPPLLPGKALCSGINYKAHAHAAAVDEPTEPFFFAKLPSSFVGHEAPVAKSPFTNQFDYEVELAVVIGKPLHHAREDEVMPAIFGYTLLNDLSAREVQKTNHQVTLGKNFAGAGPIGPCIVSADEFGDPNTVQLQTRLNGRLLQDGNTSEWLFPLPQLISYLTRFIPLEPGDLVSTGTPAGNGTSRNPQIFLKAGDVVEISADRIGMLRTPIV